MKRLDLVQLTIIITGIISAFFCLKLIPGFIFYCISWFGAGLKGGYMMGAFINNIAFIAVYLLFALLTIRSSKQLAEWISTKADLQGDINFSLKKQELLFVLFLGLGIYGLINELPGVLKDGYDLIRDSNKHPLLDDFVDSKKTTNDTFFIELIKSFLFLTLVIYAHVFAAFFARKIDNLEPVDELNNQTED